MNYPIQTMNFLSKTKTNSFSSSLIFVVIITSTRQSSAQPTFWVHYCESDTNYTANSAFAANLDTFLSSMITGSLLAGAGNTNYYNFTIGTKPDDFLAGTASCRDDISPSDCHACCTDAAVEIRQVCPTQKEGMGFYSNCAVRYANRPILGTMQSSPKFSNTNNVNATDVVAFDGELVALLRSLQGKVGVGDRRNLAYGSMRGRGSDVPVYAL